MALQSAQSMVELLLSEKNFEQTATYSCYPGYKLVGDSISTCQATGVWSGSAPTCQRILPGTLSRHKCLVEVGQSELDLRCDSIVAVIPSWNALLLF